MAFQGTPQPDLIGLALNLMQMRRDNELQNRKMALEEARLQLDQQQAAVQAQRDEADWQLDYNDRLTSFEDKMTDRERSLAPTLAASGNPLLGQTAQQTAANQFIRAIDQQIALGRDPGLVGGNAGAALVEGNQKTFEDVSTKESDAEREDRFRQKAEARAEARAKRAEDRREARARREASFQADAEAAAAAAGKWSATALDKRGAVEESRLSFAPEVSRMWGRLENINEANPNDVFEMTYMAQKAIDEGGVVRMEDVNQWRAQGFSGFEAALASAQSFYDKNKRYPPGFGAGLKRTLSGILQSQDEKTVAYAEDFDDYAEQNGWNEPQKKRAERFRKQKELARQRVEARSAGSTAPAAATATFADRPLTRSEYDVAVKSLLASGRYKSEAEIPDAEVNALVAQRRAKSPGRTGRMGDR